MSAGRGEGVELVVKGEAELEEANQMEKRGKTEQKTLAAAAAVGVVDMLQEAVAVLES